LEDRLEMLAGAEPAIVDAYRADDYLADDLERAKAIVAVTLHDSELEYPQIALLLLAEKAGATLPIDAGALETLAGNLRQAGHFMRSRARREVKAKIKGGT
jgi:hypothetical protein